MAEQKLNEGQRAAVLAVSEELHADVLLFNGGLEGDVDRRIVLELRERQARTERRPNVLLAIRTNGGSADIAYRIARALQRSYSRFIVLIDDNCKSAGTLLAVGGWGLVMGDLGELGPLDVQLQKPDELWEMSSGMVATDALSTLGSQAFELWESIFIDVRRRSGMQISTRRSAEIATEMAIGLFSPLYAQLDPLRLAENTRWMRVAMEYGNRLNQGNLKEGALARLISGYPSHGFAIDRNEASSLFERVREPSAAEHKMVVELAPEMAKLGEGRVFQFVDDLVGESSEEHSENGTTGLAGSPQSAESTNVPVIESNGSTAEAGSVSPA